MSTPKRFLLSVLAALIFEAVLTGSFWLTFNLEHELPHWFLYLWSHDPAFRLVAAFGLKDNWPALFASSILMAVVWTAVFFGIASWRHRARQRFNNKFGQQSTQALGS